jgi:hypothetical protein
MARDDSWGVNKRELGRTKEERVDGDAGEVVGKMLVGRMVVGRMSVGKVWSAECCVTMLLTSAAINFYQIHAPIKQQRGFARTEDIPIPEIAQSPVSVQVVMAEPTVKASSPQKVNLLV